MEKIYAYCSTPELEANGVEVCATISEKLFNCLTGYLETHPNVDLNVVVERAIALYLLQNGHGQEKTVSRIYAQSLFPRQREEAKHALTQAALKQLGEVA